MDRHVDRQEKTNRIIWRNTERRKNREPSEQGPRHIHSNRDKREGRMDKQKTGASKISTERKSKQDTWRGVETNTGEIETQ